MKIQVLRCFHWVAIVSCDGFKYLYVRLGCPTLLCIRIWGYDVLILSCCVFMWSWCCVKVLVERVTGLVVHPLQLRSGSCTSASYLIGDSGLSRVDILTYTVCYTEGS